jgi:hypothetical protein
MFEYLYIRWIGLKTFILFFILILTSPFSHAQMSKEEVLSLLTLEDSDSIKTISQVDIIYERYLDFVSYQPNDLLHGIGYSALSGIGEGAVESNEFGYTNSGWLPVFLKRWYDDSPGNFGNANYNLFGWQEIWREVDYASDRAAYQSLKLFFKGKWYYALVLHWLIKNTFATIIRDKFRYNNYLFSFRFDFIISFRR